MIGREPSRNRRGPPFGLHPGNQRGSPFGLHPGNQRGSPFGLHPGNQRGSPFGHNHGPQKGPLFGHNNNNKINNNSVLETLYCEYGNSSCECKEEADVCIFNLEIDEIQTFTSYQKFFVNEPTGIATRGFEGVGYYINESGIPLPLGDPRAQCATLNNANCTSPQFVDGKTYRMAIAVNGQIPGPTLIVHEGQIVIVHVHNNLTTEGISVHWHGIHQRESPYMDGVGQVTQCQIGPSSSFSYQYKASPPGTFWYHSHSGTQRTDGLFGGLIVKEKKNITRIINLEVQDLPDQHTLTLIEWQNQASLDLFTQFKAGGFYEDKPIGEVPTPSYNKLRPTSSFDNGFAGAIPYFSGIINGKGRHADVPYNKTRLSIFTVEPSKTYRFRLIGAQETYAYNFSIDGHKLTVVATDGYWINPIDNVDYIIIQTGERYDFLLNATEKVKDYWIRAETLEINKTAGGPPYPTLNHVAEAILHYKEETDSENPDDNVPPTEYESIKNESPARQCSKDNQCIAVNCPFEKFHRSYNITCFNVQNFSLLEPTPDNELPNAYPDASCRNCTHFINFNFEGASTTSSVNGRNFILPSFPPQTQNQDFLNNSKICDPSADCNPSTIDCSCVYMIDIPYNKTVQFVFSNIGRNIHSHPIHLHGHSFHVVYVGYPEYNQTNGFVKEHNKDIFCDDVNCTNGGCNNKSCTRPRWASEPPQFSINRNTVRKDTITVPAGGYVIINFISDNPGHWFLHCHIEGHQLEGMALIVNEASEEQKKLEPPPEIEKIKCGNLELSYEKPYSYRMNN